jgi:hypothetical protein
VESICGTILPRVLISELRMMKKILRSVGWFLRGIITEGNPGAGPAGSDRARQESSVIGIANQK